MLIHIQKVVIFCVIFIRIYNIFKYFVTTALLNSAKRRYLNT